MPPLKMNKLKTCNISTDSGNLPSDKTKTANGARIYTITMIQPVANKINRKHLLTNFRSSVFAI